MYICLGPRTYNDMHLFNTYFILNVFLKPYNADSIKNGLLVHVFLAGSASKAIS